MEVVMTLINTIKIYGDSKCLETVKLYGSTNDSNIIQIYGKSKRMETVKLYGSSKDVWKYLRQRVPAPTFCPIQ